MKLFFINIFRDSFLLTISMNEKEIPELSLKNLLRNDFFLYCYIGSQEIVFLLKVGFHMDRTGPDQITFRSKDYVDFHSTNKSVNFFSIHT